MYLTLLLSVALLPLAHNADARGAGRAFPVLSENYAIEKFQSVNPSIEWDPTNFLVDKSGQFAHCHDVHVGYELTGDVGPEGVSIGAVYDYVKDNDVDAELVNGYIMDTVDKWMQSEQYHDVIRDADRFGCSVRPGCSYQAQTVTTIVCLFSPGMYQDKPVGKQEALAFTPEQYVLAETITGNVWDRSHFLENLCELEASCSMLGDTNWTFNETIPVAKDEYFWDVLGLKGEAPNLGSTQQAMEIILKQFQQIEPATLVGCSVIPDCTVAGSALSEEMWVVVTCLYEDPTSERAHLDELVELSDEHKEQ